MVEHEAGGSHRKYQKIGIVLFRELPPYSVIELPDISNFVNGTKLPKTISAPC